MKQNRLKLFCEESEKLKKNGVSIKNMVRTTPTLIENNRHNLDKKTLLLM